MKKLLALIVTALLITACAKPPVFKEAVKLKSKEVISKNYKIGVKKTAYVGDSIMKAQHYIVHNKQKGDSATPYSKYTVYDVVLPIHEGGVERHKIIGNITYKNKTYILVQMGPSLIERRRHSLLVSPNGRVYTKAIYREGYEDVFDLTISIKPKNLRFKFKNKKEYEVNEDEPNFELIYGGIEDGKILFTYREFSGKSIKRASYTQNLSVGKNKKIFRFRDIRIAIISADDETITYKVNQD